MNFKLYKEPIIIVVGTVLIAFLLLHLFFFPRLNTIENYKGLLESQRARNVRIKQLAKQADFFTSLIQKVDQYRREIQALLPKEIKLSILLRELSVLAEKNNVAIISVRPLEAEGPPEQGQAPIKSRGYVTSDIEIVLESNYEQLGRYIEAIENNNLTIMAIRHLNVVLDDESAETGRLKGIMTVEAFYKTS